MPAPPSGLDVTRKLALPRAKILRKKVASGPRPGLGSDIGMLTRQFFLEGDAHEAANYRGVILDDEAHAPKVEFRSFDKIPRTRLPVLLLFMVALVGVVGMLAWRSTDLVPESGWVSAAARAMVHHETAPASAPPAAPAPASQAVPPSQPARAPAAPAAAAAPARAPAAVAEAPTEDPPVTRAPAAPAPNPAPPAMATSPAETRPAPAHPRRSNGAGAAKRTGPLRGYVWSPASNSMVPVLR